MPCTGTCCNAFRHVVSSSLWYAAIPTRYGARYSLPHVLAHPALLSEYATRSAWEVSVTAVSSVVVATDRTAGTDVRSPRDLGMLWNAHISKYTRMA
jgi:hypothetical protein